MLFQKGINWANYPAKFKDGCLIVKEKYEKISEFNGEVAIRTRWVVNDFTQDYLRDLIFNVDSKTLS